MTNIILVLVVLVSLASGSPIRNHHQGDLLTGSDFLAVFMRSSSNRHGDTQVSGHNRHTTTTDSYFPDSNDVLYRDVPHQESQFEHPEFKITDIEFDRDYPILGSSASSVDEETTTGATTVQDEVTTVTTNAQGTEEQEYATEPPPSQVVSVRVSSSVVRSKPVTTEKQAVLSTEDQPSVTAVQRSHFGVDEGSPSVSYHPPTDEAFRSVSYQPPTDQASSSVSYQPPADGHKVVTYSEEHTVFRVEERQSKFQRVPVSDSVAEASQAYRSRAEQTVKQDNKDQEKTDKGYTEATGAEGVSTYTGETDPQKTPISYQTSVSSATSGSRVQFYREPPSYNRQDKQIEEKRKEEQKKAEQNYEVSEGVYGHPEQNYEVDEAVSVVTNGRAHGVQTATEPETTVPTEEDRRREAAKKHRFSYVVEGSNYRKYRVEEQTPDGFIVGEYGVVSHNDGSLRGVRYTADRGVNRGLIYQALIKFLSLK